MSLADRQAEFCLQLMPAYPMRSAAAIGGNATQESLVQPVTVGSKDHGSDGVLQWRLERLTGPDGLMPWCAAQRLQWDTLKAQALFTMHELDQPQYAVLKADLKSGAKSLETLTLNFCDAFERPSVDGRAAEKRIGYAHDCLAILMRNAGTPTSDPMPHFPAPVPIPMPLPSIPTSGTIQVPIALIIQLVAPLAESLVKGLLQGALAHAQQSGTIPMPGPAAPMPAMPQFDFAQLAQLIAAELAKLQQIKPGA